jgi:2'-5' RNA ligase
MNKIRAFLAVNLPVKVIQSIAEVQAKLCAAAKETNMKVAWVPPPNMHVTLKFLADIHEETVWGIGDLLKNKLEGRPAFSVSVEGLDAFPNRQKPKVLWVGIRSEGKALDLLANDLEQWLEELGFVKESRPFHGHLTLGRVKQPASIDVLEGLESFSLGESSISEIVLYKSVLQRRGADYSPLIRFPLKLEQDQYPEHSLLAQPADIAAFDEDEID